VEQPEPRPFAHLDAPNAGLYRRCMAVFLASKRRFVVHLRPEDVAEALRADGPAASAEGVAEALDQLTTWGNLRADPDTSRVATVEDFYRARYLYQFSREGEAAERALETYEQALGRRGELQAVALEDIRLRLRALRDLATPAHPDPVVVHSLLLELTGRLDSLADNASAFMAGLQRTIDLQDVDEDAFLAYKDRLIAYLERFVSDLVVKSHDIASTLRGFDPARIDALLLVAAAREAADVAPDAPDADAAAARKAVQWRERWSGLWSWFVGDRAHPSQATLLRQRARKAIPDLLATISVLQDRHAGRSDRSADFRELARWFATATSDDDAHRLWRAAFGLSSSRHLGGEATDEVVAGTAWSDAAPVRIAARLRATGHYQRRGGPRKVVDRSAGRQLLSEQATAERAQTEAAIGALATGRPTRLGDVRRLDRHEFPLFLRLLGEALAAGPPGRDGTTVARTSDGALEVTLTRIPGGGTITIDTDDGLLHGPDHEITVVDLRGGRVPTGGGEVMAGARPSDRTGYAP
jgi:uncharacterized protein (TIGR02677 family)